MDVQNRIGNELVDGQNRIGENFLEFAMSSVLLIERI